MPSEKLNVELATLGKRQPAADYRGRSLGSINELPRAAYHGLLVPLLGFLFLPLTTLVYAWIVNTHQPVTSVQTGI